MSQRGRVFEKKSLSREEEEEEEEEVGPWLSEEKQSKCAGSPRGRPLVALTMWPASLSHTPPPSSHVLPGLFKLHRFPISPFAHRFSPSSTPPPPSRLKITAPHSSLHRPHHIWRSDGVFSRFCNACFKPCTSSDWNVVRRSDESEMSLLRISGNTFRAAAGVVAGRELSCLTLLQRSSQSDCFSGVCFSSSDGDASSHQWREPLN